MHELDVAGDITAAKEIRVALVPIGNISERKFVQFANLIKTFSVIELGLTPTPPTKGTMTRSGSTQRWWQGGRVYPRFVDSRTTHRSDWEDFQVHRKTLGVVGIIHCAQWRDLSDAYTEFERLRRQHPTAVAVTCFAFEPRDDQPDFAKDNLVMIPNGDQKRLLFYLNTLLLDFMATILKELETLFENEQAWSSAYISTPLDPHNPSADKVNRLKKRKAGRVNKTKGDYCLLAGDPQDALLHYQAAEEQARQNADMVWLAGALEGQAAAMIMSASTTEAWADVPAVDEKYAEALGLYAKSHAVTLELEASLKLAGYHAWFGRKVQALELLMHAHALSSECSTQERILVCSAIAGLCRRLGFNRKFAFFIREAAALHHKLFMMSTAHSLYLVTAPHYQLQSLQPSHSQKRDTAQSWLHLQRSLLRALIATSRALNDATASAAYALALLRTFKGDKEHGEEQVELATELARLTKYTPASPHIDPRGALPQLLGILPLRPSDDMVPLEMPKTKPAVAVDNDNPFIFTPMRFQKSHYTPPVVAKGDLVTFKAYLANPFAFQVHLESVSLATDGAEFDAYPVLAVTLPPHAVCHEVVLCGKALAAGSVRATGCLIHALNILCLHAVDGRGLPIVGDPTHAGGADGEVHGRLPLVLELPKVPETRNLPREDGPENATEVVVVEVLPLLTLSTVGPPIRQLAFEKQLGGVEIEVRNVSGLPIEWMNLHAPAADGSDDDGATNSGLVWDADVVAAHLPLAPGHSFVLPVRFRFGVHMKDGRVVVEYGEKEGTHKRRAAIDIQADLLGGQLPVVVTNLSVLPYGRLPALPNCPALPEGQEDDYAVLLFELHNTATLAFTVHCAVTDPANTLRVVCEPRSHSKLAAVVRRLPSDGSLSAREAALACKAGLIQRVSLWWISSWGHRGDISLASLSVPAPLLMSDPVRISLACVSGGGGGGGDGETDIIADPRIARVMCGEFSHVRVRVENRSAAAVSLLLRVQAYQSTDAGQPKVSLLNKLLWMGSLHVTFHNVPAGEAVEHTVGLCAVQPGRYGLQASATNELTNDTHWATHPLTLHASLPSPFSSLSSSAPEPAPAREATAPSS